MSFRRYVAPAAFLLAATIAVIVIQSGLRTGKSGAPPPAAASTGAVHKRPAHRFWTVRAGDTFAVISSKTGVPMKRIERLNPKVTSTSLFIGERLRLR